jgi:phosphoribosylformimino-5-aminoimidazole carboxamide ribotide isomerase
MRIIGVIDLRGGRAVHARGGRREAYAPVGTAAGVTVNGDAIILARTYIEMLGVRELYMADLDAIGHGASKLQRGVIGGLGSLDAPLWVDAGVSTAEEAGAVLDAGASVAIIGLETLPSFDTLGATCAGIGGERVAFSLDLRDGVPIVSPNAARKLSNVRDIAARAADVGAGSIIVLDLARVGSEVGIDLHLMEEIRRAAPGVALIAGGGVRDLADLDALSAVGCDGALVATALLSGAIDLTATRRAE